MLNEKCSHHGISVTWQVLRKLEDAILQGCLVEEGFMYPTRQIMSLYNVSDKTAQRAIGFFHEYGFLYQVRGKGLKIESGTKDKILMARMIGFKNDIEYIIHEARLLKVSNDELDDIIQLFHSNFPSISK